MKKIISLIAAVSMACTTLVTSAFAFDTTAVVIKSNTTQLTNETFYEYYGEDIPEGQAAYLVNFDVAGLKDSLKYSKTGGTNAKPKYTGSALDNMEIILSADDISAINQDYSYILNHSCAAAPGEGFGDNTWSTNYAGNFIYPAAKDVEGVTEGSTTDFISMCFVIDADATITFSPEGTVSILSYSNSIISDQADFTNVEGATSLTFEPAAITLGSKPEPVVSGADDADDVTVTDDNKGKVWNNVKIEDVALGQNYKVKFSDGTDNVTYDLNLNNKEVNGDIDFAVVLKTTKELANITMDILYDLVD